MVTLINPEDSTWQFIGSFSAVAKNAIGCRRSFIEPFRINTLLSSQFLAVGILVNNAKKHWQDGGEIIQDFRFSNNDSRYFDIDRAFYSPQKLIINRVNIIKIPLITDAYTIVYFPNAYFTSLTLELWEYKGEVIEREKAQIDILDNNLQALQKDINAIQRDINAIQLGDTLGRLIDFLNGIELPPPTTPEEPTETPTEEPTEPTNEIQ